MIFTIKQEDMRYKARFVMNGNVIDASVENKICLGNEPKEIKPSTSNKGDSQVNGEDKVTDATPNNSQTQY